MVDEATLDKWMATLKEQCAVATPEQFRNRLEISTLIYAFVAKQFAARYPEEYAKWEEETA